ncbi:MAG: CBS domain-containing protein [Gammaproteobacteria bacterium]|nr:CBS domain-containing protein [Gammaproteobacteria bacterium]NIM73038.1 CBS domain-containing protein [Gammaproteobacteria bacterium]NIN38655.1 CBS domain-containing protein [Gammaproteobacteria bacterium]NIO24791.1 CBS domain-containing protein [Gammaproteobacteria bacterium]NIO65394.1 CBS domain-containing protein [Gammaproteobacteria bacterium]
MRVKDFMSTQVVSAPVGTPVNVAYELMRDGGFRHLPVLNNKGKLVGIISERDLRGVGAFFKDAESGVDEFLVTEPTTVENIMVREPITVTPDTTVSAAVKIIRDKRIGALIVMQGEEMVGILSYLDVLDAAEREQEEPTPLYRDPNDTQPLSKRDLRNLREQLASELTEFRASTPNPTVSKVDVRARQARIAEQEARRRAREKERAEATQEIMNDIRSQLNDDD